MQWDDDVCYCYHVSLRKLWNFARQTRPQRVSRMCECLGAGTGCGWCIPTLKKIHQWAETGQLPGSISEQTSDQYAAQRQDYIKEQRPRNQF